MSDVPVYLHLPGGSTPPDLGGPSPFRAVVMVEQIVPLEWQMAVSDWLVRSGCLSMMAWGRDCGYWDDSVDLASLRILGYGEIPDDQLVMTSWHEHESLSDVFSFSKRHAFHSEVELQRTLLVHIADRSQEPYMLRTYAEA
ncbi:hypothetical protein FKV24_004980 [Lysobacter maris]|uniref:DUF7684 domain-containing protein n=1 Tax=Marilutibacter maris TaxID=1605891 RepID=A0A5N6CRM7_9GAMM|nr:hypothetical protein [Lysobacter maris]KAB8195626.1 hypothetical protein FKV24_004980 [Lysobacter maris]